MDEKEYQDYLKWKAEGGKKSGFSCLGCLGTGVAVFIAIVIILLVITGIENSVKSQRDDESTLSKDTVEAPDRAYIERMDSIQEARVKKSIKITAAYLSQPNSVGGVDAYVYYKNISGKTIKYLTWYGYAINAVGDRVACTIRRDYEFAGKDTGPIKSGKKGGGVWECAWYNSTAKVLQITSIHIEYMDGETLFINSGEIDLVK